MTNAIVDRDTPVLREQAQLVPVDAITTSEIKKALHAMQVALDEQLDGVAIAAPQIGISLQIFLVSKRAFETYTDQPLVYINPTITKASKDKSWMQEGCLSVRWDYGETHRHNKVTVEAYDEHGKKFSRGASGLLAQIFQHEIDHLNGILFIDHARNIKAIPPEDIVKHAEHGDEGM